MIRKLFAVLLSCCFWSEGFTLHSALPFTRDHNQNAGGLSNGASKELSSVDLKVIGNQHTSNVQTEPGNFDDIASKASESDEKILQIVASTVIDKTKEQPITITREEPDKFIHETKKDSEADNKIAAEEATVCCMPLVWEGLLYLDYGTVFIDKNTAFAYMNGSVHAAYSFPRKKVFFNITGVELSPLIPKPVPDDTLLLYDFEGKTMYTVNNGECQKSSLESNMTHQCIPRDAKEVSVGVYKSGEITRVLHTYEFSTNIDIPYDIRATIFKNDLTPIEPKTCYPMYVNYFTPSVNPDSGTMYGLQFLDIGPLKSQSIFNIPDSCKGV